MSFNLRDIGNEVQGRGYGWQAGLAGSPRHSFPTALQLIILEITLQLRGAARRPGLAFLRVLELTGCAIATPRPQQLQQQYSWCTPCAPLNHSPVFCLTLLSTVAVQRSHDLSTPTYLRKMILTIHVPSAWMNESYWTDLEEAVEAGFKPKSAMLWPWHFSSLTGIVLLYISLPIVMTIHKGWHDPINLPASQTCYESYTNKYKYEHSALGEQLA